jgi:hypothetical protein
MPLTVRPRWLRSQRPGVFGVALKFFDWLIELLHYSIESPGNGIGTYLRISALLLSACPDHCQDAH